MSVEDTKLRLLNSTQTQVSTPSAPEANEMGDERLSLTSTAEAFASRSISRTPDPPTRDKPQDVYEHFTETAVVRIIDIDTLVIEWLDQIPLLESDSFEDPDQKQYATEEQLETLGAIRAVQKKVIKLVSQAASISQQASDLQHNGRPKSDSPVIAGTETNPLSQQPQEILRPVVVPSHQSNEVPTGRVTEKLVANRVRKYWRS